MPDADIWHSIAKSSEYPKLLPKSSTVPPQSSHFIPTIPEKSREMSPISHNEKDMCLCGLLNLSLSVHLICCIEVFFSMVLLIQSPDLITMDGTYFYFLGMLEGCGEYFFALHFLMSVSCVLTALLLYVGSRSRRPAYVLPHYLWQISFIVMTIILSIVLLNLGLSGKMLLPSSIVLSCMLLVPGIAEIWWSYLTLCYYRQLLSKSSVYKRPKAPNMAPFRATEC